jgi:hypothetical protein
LSTADYDEVETKVPVNLWLLFYCHDSAIDASKITAHQLRALETPILALKTKL